MQSVYSTTPAYWAVSSLKVIILKVIVQQLKNAIKYQVFEHIKADKFSYVKRSYLTKAKAKFPNNLSTAVKETIFIFSLMHLEWTWTHFQVHSKCI